MNVKATFDALYSQWIFNIDGVEYVFDTRRLPFRLFDAEIDGERVPAADHVDVVSNSHKQVRHRYHG